MTVTERRPTPTEVTPDMTLAEAKEWLRARLVEGEKCPCCTQMARQYKRAIPARSALSLITVWRLHGQATSHWPTVLGHTQADEAKLVHWGIIAEADVERDDGGRAGFWRITDLGARWVTGEVAVPKFVDLYDSRLIRSPYGEPWTIRDALGKKFDLRDLLDGQG